tara:strand:- start:158 stop:574 length:417 start_codon:yes stop_codon:yes gene_type:complete
MLFLGNNIKKIIMGYGMKYTKGGFPFKTVDLTKKTGLGPRATQKELPVEGDAIDPTSEFATGKIEQYGFLMGDEKDQAVTEEDKSPLPTRPMVPTHGPTDGVTGKDIETKEEAHARYNTYTHTPSVAEVLRKRKGDDK